MDQVLFASVDRSHGALVKGVEVPLDGGAGMQYEEGATYN